MTLSSDDMKKAAAAAALEYVEHDMVVGIGTGSTANHFIDLLAGIKARIDGAVASSEASAERLRGHGIPVFDLNKIGDLALYVDGADESDHQLNLIKGGGAALTREKIVAAASEKFICIADESKLVDTLGTFPLPVEVIPMAQSYIGRQIIKLGGDPALRDGCITDNGNVIIDIHGLNITDPKALEQKINALAGVVSVGLFAREPADVLILGGPDGARTITAK